MEEKASSANSEAKKPTLQQATTQPAETEHRRAYGTAKTENLRDSGLWRILLPAIVIVFSLLVFIFPLMILIPLLLNAVTALNIGNHQEAGLLWVWISMIALEVALAIIIIQWLYKVFLTQAGNYR